jgi:hypothetical protein
MSIYNGNPTSLGGGTNGISPKPIIISTVNQQTSNHAMNRGILRRAWNTKYASGMVNERVRVITPFRAVNNAGDYLARGSNYVCGGSNTIQPNARKGISKGNIGSIFSVCDNSGIEPSNCNNKWVYDSSYYTRFRKEKALNNTYNDYNFGGNKNNAEFVPLTHVRRGIH